MNIIILARPEGRIIAREYHCDRAEGWFFIEDDGTVFYTSPYDTMPRFVNHSLQQFCEAVHFYSEYGQHVQQDEGGAITIFVQRIRTIDGYPHPDCDFWPLILEQIEHGLL